MDGHDFWALRYRRCRLVMFDANKSGVGEFSIAGVAIASQSTRREIRPLAEARPLR